MGKNHARRLPVARYITIHLLRFTFLHTRLYYQLAIAEDGTFLIKDK